ncbi:hypothetical protein RHSIM_Rhsim10G0052900 [Rhododendron simsii]|uniref:Protein kinase domain-containing protein n=1 Tax=Rhododendron simsii TaxID=118357 RepID=A0A834G9C6_RHOSS|nr:hypothetical protein RHSIM_Rhsim10G0052900 [Rhododendron simsii]
MVTVIYSSSIILDEYITGYHHACSVPDDQLPVKPNQTKQNRDLCPNQLLVKNDMCCFVVLLVEMLTGSRAPERLSQYGSLGWVEPYLADRKKLTIIMDSRLKGKYPPEAALGIAHLALNCLRAYLETRPLMKEVLKTLERINASNEKPLGASN